MASLGRKELTAFLIIFLTVAVHGNIAHAVMTQMTNEEVNKTWQTCYIHNELIHYAAWKNIEIISYDIIIRFGCDSGILVR